MKNQSKELSDLLTEDIDKIQGLVEEVLKYSKERPTATVEGLNHQLSYVNCNIEAISTSLQELKTKIKSNL